jgi:hypothetical protein
MDDSQNAQALTPTLSRGERVRTAEIAVANSEKINRNSFIVTAKNAAEHAAAKPTEHRTLLA